MTTHSLTFWEIKYSKVSSLILHDILPITTWYKDKLPYMSSCNNHYRLTFMYTKIIILFPSTLVNTLSLYKHAHMCKYIILHKNNAVYVDEHLKTQRFYCVIWTRWHISLLKYDLMTKRLL